MAIVHQYLQLPWGSQARILQLGNTEINKKCSVKTLPQPKVLVVPLIEKMQKKNCLIECLFKTMCVYLTETALSV